MIKSDRDLIKENSIAAMKMLHEIGDASCPSSNDGTFSSNAHHIQSHKVSKLYKSSKILTIICVVTEIIRQLLFHFQFFFLTFVFLIPAEHQCCSSQMEAHFELLGSKRTNKLHVDLNSVFC